MSDKVKMSVSCVKCGKHAVDWRDTVLVGGNAWPRLSEDELWNRSIQSTRIMYIKGARGILEIARKAVGE